jgi:hypothetical protein
MVRKARIAPAEPPITIKRRFLISYKTPDNTLSCY